MNRILSLLLTMVLILMPIGSIASGQQQLTSAAAIARIKTTITRLSNGGTVTIKLCNGSELKGRITATAENMFTLKEDKKSTSRDLHYADVLKVNTGSLSRGANFAIFTAFFTGAAVIGALIGLKHSGP
jgi:small nuclear ribonucleoprotein (snRNP)-like protein